MIDGGGYRKLEIYQMAHDVAVRIHKLSLMLPQYELYETGSQMRRSSKSISANIVEGYGRRRYKAEFIRFLTYAQASCYESMEWLDYVNACHESVARDFTGLSQELDDLAKKLNRFIESVEAQHRSAK
jgi:four helix bundle protein